MLDGINPRLWLMCDILEEGMTETTLRGELFDGEQFTLKVPSTLVRIEGKKGFVQVEEAGRGQDRVNIVLPVPILKFGRQISVDILFVRR